MNPEQLRQIHYSFLQSRVPISIEEEAFESRTGNSLLFGSELSMCPRRTAYRRTGATKTHPLVNADYQKLMLFESGHAMAMSWKRAILWHFGDDAWVEREVTYQGATGHVDACFIADGDIIPLEIKNTSFTELQDNHILQCQFYMAALDSEQGFVIYQRRNNNDIFPIGRNDDAVEEAILEHTLTFAGLKDNPDDNQWWTKPDILTQPTYWCCEEDPKARRPRPAERRSANYERGEIRPGDVTVCCEYFGHCYPGKTGYSYKTETNADGDVELV